MRGLGLSSLLVGVALVSPRPAHAAEGEPVSLAWSAPQGCGSADAVLEAVRSLIGDLASSSRPSIEATATVTRVARDRFHLDLTTRLDAAVGHRALDAPSCRALADATGLILAWMIDPAAMAARTSPPAPARSVVPDAAPAPTSSSSRPSPETPRPRRGVSEPSFGLTFVFDAGTLPRPQMGIGGRLAYRFFAYVSAEARASYWPESEATSADPSIEGRFSLIAAGASLCAGPRVIAVCAGPEVDWMRGASRGAPIEGEGSDAWLSLDVDGVARIPLASHVRLVAVGSWVVPSKRQLFVLQGLGVVHRPSSMAGRGAIGLEAAF